MKENEKMIDEKKINVEGSEKIKKKKAEKDNEDKKRLISRIVNIVLWVILFAWMALVFVDFLHVKNEEEPQFCMWNKKTTQYSDGKVTECTGLGYKVINYKREDFNAIEFGPFWIKDRTAKTK